MGQFDYLYDDDFQEPVVLKDPNDLLGMKDEDVDKIVDTIQVNPKKKEDTK